MALTALSLDVRLLGRPRFALSGVALTFAGFPRLPLLFAYLLLNSEAHRRDRLAFTLWPDDTEETARANLRRHLHALATFLPKTPEPWILVTPAFLQWNPAAKLHFDVAEFQRLSASEESLAEAVELYEGDLLDGFDEEWIERPRSEYRNLQLRNLALLARAHRERSEFAAAISTIRQTLAIDPWREDALRELLTVRSESGDRAGALAEYRAFVERLRDEIGAEPAAETRELYEQLQKPRLQVTRASTNLAAEPSRFIGRSSEVESLQTLLQNRRLVTICGPPGIGKSRLALHAARENAPGYSGGVWELQLANLSDEAEILSETLLRAMRVVRSGSKPALETLSDAIGEARMLVVFDSCEHALSAAGSVAHALLAHCENVQIVATSREPLKMAAETILRLAPMPAADAQTLFLERAASLDPHYLPYETDQRAIVEICERLEGIPLAVELAAARTNVLSPPEIADKLSSLMQSRHPLRVALEWSHDLFSASAKTLFARLGVFAGGFTLDAVQHVCAERGRPADEIIDVLSDLVDKSFVIAAKGTSGTRYGMLDTLAEFARERLQGREEEREMRLRHSRYYTALVHSEKPIAQIAAEIDNVREVLREGKLDLAADLYPVWLSRSFYGEGRHWIGEFLKHSRGVPPQERGAALNALAVLATLEGDLNAAESSAREALSILEKLGDSAALSESLHALGFIAHERGDPDGARAFFGRSLDAARAVGDTRRMARALDNIGLEFSLLGNFEGARTVLQLSLELYQQLHDEQDIAWVFYHLAQLAYHRAHYSEALALHEKSLAFRRKIEDEYGVASSLEGIAQTWLARGDGSKAREKQCDALRIWKRIRVLSGIWSSLEVLGTIALRENDVESAALFYAAAQRARESTGANMNPAERALFDEDVKKANALRPEGWNDGWRNAQTLSLDTVVDLALSR